MHVKTQVVLQGASNLPEDRFITTWHFNPTAADLAAAAVIIGPALASAIGTTSNVNADGLHQYLSEFVLRPFTMRHYDMAQAEPRVPYVQSYTLPAYTTGTTVKDLPEEVACCLSIVGAPPVTARRRGRLFWGPLNTLAITDASTALPVRISPTFRTQAATALLALAGGTSAWSIYSPTNDNLVPVVGGFIDNACDTQRRRGPDASARTTWALP
jgi:hypothetical protein